MSIFKKVNERKILHTPLEPPSTSWLWLKTEDGVSTLYDFVNGKWTPVGGYTEDYEHGNHDSEWGGDQQQNGNYVSWDSLNDALNDTLTTVEGWLGGYLKEADFSNYVTKDELSGAVSSSMSGVLKDYQPLLTAGQSINIVSFAAKELLNERTINNLISVKMGAIGPSKKDPISGATAYTEFQKVYDALGGKQATLVSGTNIKTVNNSSLLGNGNIAVQTPIFDLATIRSGAAKGATSVQTITVNGNTLRPLNGNVTFDAIPGGGNEEPSSTNKCNVKKIDKLSDWSGDYIDSDLQNFVIPDYTFYDFIYYESDTSVNWSSSSNKKLNPSKWEVADYRVWSSDENKFVAIDRNLPYRKTWIGNSTTNENTWKNLKQKTNPSSKDYVYISYRTRHISSNQYSEWSSPITWNELSNNSALLSKIVDTESWDITETLRNNFINTNADALENAAKTRDFLQRVIDSAKPDEVIMFPENETFVIDFNPLGYYDGFGDLRVEYDPFTIGKMLVYKSNGELVTDDHVSVNNSSIRTIGGNPNYYNKVTFSGLEINHKVTIDLNGSTIKFVPNWLPNFKVVHVGTYEVFGDGNAEYNVTTDPSGTVIRNGKIDGGIDGIMFFAVHARTHKAVNGYFELTNIPLMDYEHGHTLSASKKVSIQSIDVGNVIGDGLCVSSEYSWNTGSDELITMDVNDGGGNWHSSAKKSIAAYNSKSGKHWDILVRPFYGTNGPNAKVDIGPYYVSEYYTVTYYNSSNAVVGTDTLQFGDTLNIPEGAKKFTFAIKIDQDVDATRPKLMICSVIWAKGTEIVDCNIHDCGRDGMTLSCLKNPVIRNNHITRCVQAIIDIESTAYCDNDIHIDGLTSEFNDRGFACKTGDHLMLERSKISGVYGDEPYMHISDCDVDYLVLGPTEGAGAETTFNSNISKPRRVVRDSIIRGTVDCVNTLFENCIFTGNFNVHLHNNYCGKYPNTFNHCTFKVPSGGYKGMSPGIYNDCIVRGEGSVQLQMYMFSSPELSSYVFRNCTFDVGSIYSQNNSYSYDYRFYPNQGVLLDVDNCEFNLRDHLAALYLPRVYGSDDLTDSTKQVNVFKTNFIGCFVRKFVNSVINFQPNTSREIEFSFAPYTNCVVENNVFNPLSEVTAISFMKFLLQAVDDNDAYNITVKGNTVKYYSEVVEGSNVESRFVFIHPTSDSNVLQLRVLDNVFVHKGTSSNGKITDAYFVADTYSTGYGQNNPRIFGTGVDSGDPIGHSNITVQTSGNVAINGVIDAVNS